MSQYWLVKTEPDVYSFEQLIRDKKTHWNGVRNFQARNNLKLMKQKDLVLVYHSQGPKSVVGLAEVVKEFYPDKAVKADDPKGEWVMVDLAAVEKFPHEVSLSQIKGDTLLSKMALVKQSRLSVMPVTKEEFCKVLALGGLSRE